ncbi:hypothetical protein CAXC1_150003 [Candidatus Xenohaliotis californiensis]|uniref:Uncharacterized protein n=1 Tax=Candidatus Xenohaliotis californiensis TaxID=84677 RepID=A0ABP0ERS8_9RICK|nr:hypothetical protein CAXC1_150003 [Candidatus Xenohaliotis californiensis]
MYSCVKCVLDIVISMAIILFTMYYSIQHINSIILYAYWSS